ncbi:MAG: XRE family transcriptional regulator [Desulfobacterales bacterium]|jgi:Zn-dependent peptidase ImmA (M78 family)/transcriptional regulator with XRE-family HTH domain
MAVSPQELGRRLREARESAGMTQEQVSRKLGLSRASVAQMELGNRQVTSLELDRLAYLYGRDIRQFLAETYEPQDALTVLLRANPDLTRDGKVAEGLRRCIALGREIFNLEALLYIERDAMAPAAYPTTALKSKWDAIQQGGRVALEERKRLNLGDSPLPDIMEILDGQGIRIASVPLPNDVSGLTIHEAGVGILVAVNADHGPLRQRFSLAHEYAHVLLDRQTSGSIISRGNNRSELMEMRANSFAAVFLMPDEGVRRYVQVLGKGKPSRSVADVFDETDVTRVQRRSKPGTQQIRIYDLVLIAYRFSVSTIAALFRLQNLGLLNNDQVERLRDDIDRGLDKDAAKLMGLERESGAPLQLEFKHRFVGLAIEAYRRELISKAKLHELTKMVNVSLESALRLIDNPKENNA